MKYKIEHKKWYKWFSFMFILFLHYWCWNNNTWCTILHKFLWSSHRWYGNSINWYENNTINNCYAQNQKKGQREGLRFGTIVRAIASRNLILRIEIESWKVNFNLNSQQKKKKNFFTTFYIFWCFTFLPFTF